MPNNVEISQGKKLTVGIIGAGDVVAKSHLPLLLALDEISVVWITDIDDGRAKQVARNYRVEWLPIPKQLETLPYTDIVLLAIPYGVRAPYYEVLQQRNTALYVEKPVARSAVEHQQLCSLFSPSKFAIGFQRRSMGTTSLLKNLVKEQVFGSLNKIEFRHGSSANVLSGKAFSSNADLAGGGVLFEHGIHGLDLALYISDAKSAHSYRVNTIIDKGFDVHAEGAVSLVNCAGEFDLDFKVSWLTETGEGLIFTFDNAVIHMSIGNPQIQLKSHDGRELMSLTDKNSLYPSTGLQALGEFWRSFIIAVRCETENHTSARSSLLTTEIIEQVFVQGAGQ